MAGVVIALAIAASVELVDALALSLIYFNTEESQKVALKYLGESEVRRLNRSRENGGALCIRGK